MSFSAAAILAEAPLGAVIRCHDGTPRPPERHVREVRDWEHRNGTGRLVERHTGFSQPMLDSFTVHEGDFGGEPNGRQVVRLADEHGRIIRRDPRRGQVRHVNVFTVEKRYLAQGDRIQRRRVDHELDLKNAERGTVETLVYRIATVRWDRDGRVQPIDLDKHRTWDHGYAETVFSVRWSTARPITPPSPARARA